MIKALHWRAEKPPPKLNANSSLRWLELPRSDECRTLRPSGDGSSLIALNYAGSVKARRRDYCTRAPGTTLARSGWR